jgi:alpha-glucosidase (family GH31 glycosyl hydrolase)
VDKKKQSMKKTLLIILITTLSFAQNANRKYITHLWKDKVLEIKTNDGLYIIKNYTSNIFETSFIPNGESFNPKSEAVIIKNNYYYALDFKETPNGFKLFTAVMEVVIQKSPFKISYLNAGKEILSEKSGYIKKDATEILEFNLDKTEVLYGGGARAVGMNRRGNRLQLYNRARYGYENHADLMNFCIPIVLSSKMYAVHFDNPTIGYLDLDSKKDNTLSYETTTGRKTYHVIVGNSWSDILQHYTQLTGTQPLPPRWALGNFSSRFGYHNQEEVERTIKKFQDEKIPVDAIILDLYWFGKTIKGTMGNLAWDKDNFPNPTKMIADLTQKGVKTVLITEPFILSNSAKWQEAVDKKVLATDTAGNPATFDFYFGNTGIIDVFKPEAKTWFWNIYKDLIQQGVSGLWGDLGEPEAFPSTAITAAGTAEKVHNIYGHTWAKLISDGFKTDFPMQRPFILMRAGYAGSQHFGMIPWSGDVSRSWGGLQSQTEIALQMGMQGMGYMHSDLGGFAGDYFDNELYIRWLQYGVFNPIFRPHAQEEVASEAVYKDIITRAKAKKQIELRYQLLPYNYTIAYQNSMFGTPLMRPLFFEEPDNKALSSVCESYLWGNDFLVSPITKPGIKTQKIYFPLTDNSADFYSKIKYVNNNWFDFYTDEKHIAGTTENIAVNENYIPTFVRGGAFIPMIKTIQNTTEYSLANFDLHYYFDAKTTKSGGGLYNDDGLSPNAFNNGKSELISFESAHNQKKLVIKIKASAGQNFISTDKTATVILHNCKAKAIEIDGKIVKFSVNKNTTTFLASIKKGTFEGAETNIKINL